jgi:ATP-binding protein involved in chromosome partitioning
MPLPMFQDDASKFQKPINNIIAVAAGKGGVGKSTVAVNLALALKLKGFSVGLMDTDIYGPSVRKMLPEDRLPSQKGSVIVPALCQGIKMISMAYFRHEGDATVVRAPIANQIVSQFIHNVEWGKLDYLIIDFPPGTGDIQLTLSQQAKLTGALMVTTPQDVAIMDVRKAINMFSQVNVPIIGVVENMSGYYHAKTDELLYLFGKGGGERLAIEEGTTFLGRIPIDPELSNKSDLGLSIFSNQKQMKHSASEAFVAISEKLLERINILKEDSESCLQSFELTWKEFHEK